MIRGEFDMDIPENPAGSRGRYNFDAVRPGMSLHVLDGPERCRVMAAFAYWVRKDARRRGAYAVSAKVGPDDPRGPGIRIWFKSRRADAERMSAQLDAGIPVPVASPDSPEDI